MCVYISYLNMLLMRLYNRAAESASMSDKRCFRGLVPLIKIDSSRLAVLYWSIISLAIVVEKVNVDEMMLKSMMINNLYFLSNSLIIVQCFIIGLYIWVNLAVEVRFTHSEAQIWLFKPFLDFSEFTVDFNVALNRISAYVCLIYFFGSHNEIENVFEVYLLHQN